MKNQAEEILGYQGRMISGSKSGYRSRHPNHFVVFNANLCTYSQGKIWYGDLDLHLDKEKLMLLSEILKEDLYVLYEMDGRFENEDTPQLSKAVVVFHPEHRYTIKEDLKQYFPTLENV